MDIESKNAMNKYQLIIATPLIMLLFGCDGEDTNIKNDSEITTITAQNSTYSTGFSDVYEVDLSQRISVSDGGSFSVDTVDVLTYDPNCQLISTTDIGFIISADSAKVCDYHYQVNSVNDGSIKQAAVSPSAEAIARVAVSLSSTDTNLTPISAVTFINEPVTVNLETELKEIGSDVTGFTLSSDVQTPYGFGTAVALPNSMSIEYSPSTDFIGIDRVLYSLLNSNTNEVRMGVLDISVSHEVNEGLDIDDNILVYANTYEEVTFDVADFVTSLDGDSFQLIYLEANNADVIPINNDINNTKFTYYTELTGNNSVSFAVSDHNGGYEIGLMVVNASPSLSIKGVSTVPNYHVTPMVSEEYILEDIDGNKVDATWTLENDGYYTQTGVKLTSDGILTIDPYFAVPYRFEIQAKPDSSKLNEYSVITKNIYSESKFIQITSGVSATTSCEILGYKSISEAELITLLNSPRPPAGLDTWLSTKYLILNDGQGDFMMYGRIEPEDTGPGDPDTRRAATITYCQSGPCYTSSFPTIEDSRWGSITTTYAPDYLICDLNI
ncbi:hypothetical protein ERW51_08595 [Aliivibrio finisterrensis]|uniref:hypothetical protein n=1 Tax=Aliivibrio finisterrensis TaxID=511998 RepID=UPI00101ECF21|nr:hypothetical protein [Aliivibrio finisterrensis]RYU68417.1 hypothetical protein ERW54_08790 [Aliivibrio finisterrensis]RYU72169.1 hypothetical protein ERW51_08595 [Aliivibrio finisterrensis]RYU75685.1 hypothetical protein ERW48_07540 [Aliivibrio finisterrensis]